MELFSQQSLCTIVGECTIILVDPLPQGQGHKYWIHNVLFGGKYDLGIFLPTKSAAVHLFHRY